MEIGMRWYLCPVITADRVGSRVKSYLAGHDPVSFGQTYIWVENISSDQTSVIETSRSVVDG